MVAAPSLALDYSGNPADRELSKMEINSDSSKSLMQAAFAMFLIDKIWGNRRSVDSTVKIDQSEGIAAPAIPEEGR